MGEYYKTKESVKEYINLAKGVSGAELIEKLKTVLQHGSRILEIGSGPGTDWQILSNDYATTGSDNSTEFLDHLISKFPNGDFLEIDAVTIKTEKKFDGIYSNKVLHHLKDDELILSVIRQAEILNKNGVICHSFWKGQGSEVFKGLFVNYHLEADIRKYFEPHFNIHSIESYAEFDENDSLLLIATQK